MNFRVGSVSQWKTPVLIAQEKMGSRERRRRKEGRKKKSQCYVRETRSRNEDEEREYGKEGEGCRFFERPES